MLKTFHFLDKSTFFNTFIVLLLFFAQGIHGQSSEHGTSFLIKENIHTTSDLFNDLTAPDSLDTQMEGTITEVCQAKGCWMKVDLSDGKEVFVRFKDYGFFVPTDSAGKEVVLNGRAFVEEMSVDDQRHYAMDKGATKEEVAKITQPKRTLRFEADGVRITH